MPASSRSRSAADARAFGRPSCRGASVRGDAQPGDRRRRSRCRRAGCARACRRSASAACRVPRLIHSTPAPFGPLNLCADSDSRSTPSARTSTGILPTDCTASVCISAPCSCAIAASAAIGLNRADLVVGVHHRDERGVGVDRLAQPVGRDDAGVIDREQRRAPAAAGERAQRVEHRLVFDRAGDEVTARRSCSSASAAPRMARLSDFGAAAGEHDLRRVRRSGAPRRPIAPRRASTLRLLAEVVDARRVAKHLLRRRAAPCRRRRRRGGSSRCSQSRHAW